MIAISDQPIDLNALIAQVEDHGSGGLVLFVGRVRNYSNGEKVVALEYEAHEPMALKKMQQICAAARERWPANKIAMVHRVGRLALGEASVAIAVVCAHRADAFAACRYAIDELKAKVPIWKKEFRPDGSFWVEGVQPANG